MDPKGLIALFIFCQWLLCAVICEDEKDDDEPSGFLLGQIEFYVAGYAVGIGGTFVSVYFFIKYVILKCPIYY